MWLIDEDREIAYENPLATAEVAGEERAARRGNRLTLTRGRLDLMLTERLHVLCRSPHGACGSVDLRATTADAPTWLHLTLMTPDASMGAFGARPRVLATLFDPRRVSTLDPFALSNLFGLTPAEARFAVLLADGHTAEEIGAALGTGAATVRTQKLRILAKLGAKRSTDAVRILRQGEALWSALPH